MSELDKLQQYLKEHDYFFKRIDEEHNKFINRHQIIVYSSDGDYRWDAICHFGSYGFEYGLLEIAGNIVEGSERVEGWLTADDIISRLER